MAYARRRRAITKNILLIKHKTHPHEAHLGHKNIIESANYNYYNYLVEPEKLNKQLRLKLFK